jgi:hypothetical protein
MHKYHPVTWLAYFCACIRSSLDYACPVFHSSLPNYLHADPERVQKRALACIFPGKAYAEALTNAGIVPIKDHHNAMLSPINCSSLYQRTKIIRSIIWSQTLITIPNTNLGKIENIHFH